MALLKDVRVGQHEGYERIVLEAEGTGLPGYRLEYLTQPPVACGSGEPVEVEGAVVLKVALRTAQAHDDAGKSTVAQRDQRPGYPLLRQVKLICDYEGEVSWAIGLSATAPYRVQTLADPTRIVVDFKR